MITRRVVPMPAGCVAFCLFPDSNNPLGNCLWDATYYLMSTGESAQFTIPLCEEHALGAVKHMGAIPPAD